MIFSSFARLSTRQRPSSSLPLFSLSTSLAQRQETEFSSITKSSRFRLKSCLSKSGSVGALFAEFSRKKKKKKGVRPHRRAGGFIKLAIALFICGADLLLKSSLFLVKMSNISFSAHCDYSRATREAWTSSSSPGAHSFSPKKMAQTQTPSRPAKSLRTPSPPGTQLRPSCAAKKGETKGS